jgi:hypothetical protein
VAWLSFKPPGLPALLGKKKKRPKPLFSK